MRKAYPVLDRLGSLPFLHGTLLQYCRTTFLVFFTITFSFGITRLTRWFGYAHYSRIDKWRPFRFYSGFVATEVAVLRFLRFYTSITMVIRYDDTTDNLLGQEFTLLAKAPGMRVDQI